MQCGSTVKCVCLTAEM